MPPTGCPKPDSSGPGAGIKQSAVEQESDVVDAERRERLGRFFDEVVEQRAFSLVERQNAFLDGVAYDEADDVHAARLADAMGAVGGLVLDGGIPPRVEDNDRVR